MTKERLEFILKQQQVPKELIIFRNGDTSKRELVKLLKTCNHEFSEITIDGVDETEDVILRNVVYGHYSKKMKFTN